MKGAVAAASKGAAALFSGRSRSGHGLTVWTGCYIS